MNEKRNYVSVNDFVEACHKSTSVGEVAKLLGLEPGTVQSRMSKYRNLGINLPKYERKRGYRLDVAAINARIAELTATE